MTNTTLAQAHQRYATTPDGPALNHLLEEVTAYSIALCRKRSITLDDAQEIAQDTAINVWQKLELYDSARSSFKTWVHRCTLDQVSIHRRRAEGHTKDIEGQQVAATPSTPVNPALLQELRTVAGPNAELLDLILALGDVSAAAKKLNITMKAACKRLDRLSKKINSMDRGKLIPEMP